MAEDDEQEQVSQEVAGTAADDREVQEADVSAEVADTQAEIKMVDLSGDHLDHEENDES